MYLEIFLANFAVFRVFWGISRDFAEIPEFRGSATARNIRSPGFKRNSVNIPPKATLSQRGSHEYICTCITCTTGPLIITLHD